MFLTGVVILIIILILIVLLLGILYFLRKKGRVRFSVISILYILDLLQTLVS